MAVPLRQRPGSHQFPPTLGKIRRRELVQAHPIGGPCCQVPVEGLWDALHELAAVGLGAGRSPLSCLADLRPDLPASKVPTPLPGDPISER